MNVLSLFDGISCARVALDRAGIPVKTYFASEVDTHAIKVSSTKYPDIVQLGDVRTVTPDGLPPIDLLIGGSPCQDLSIAKKDRKGLAGHRSGLFWEYVRIWKAVQPKWFVLENVASMPKADRDTITQTLGVEPVMFNASLVSAQSRKRLFWTNIKFDLPPDRGILLKDILQPDAEVDESMVVNGKSFCLTASYPNDGDGEHNKARKQRTMVKVGYIGEGDQYGQGGQAHRVYAIEGKIPTLSSFGPLVKLGHLGTTDGQANRVYSSDGKSVTLSANGGGLGAKTGLYAIGRDVGRRDPTRIRKLTPIECERLQGLPDNYTDTISKTQRYKCLGNGFNVDVVAHILSAIKTNGGSVF